MTVAVPSISLSRPNKSRTKYLFSGKIVGSQKGPPRFGFVATNHELVHSDFWDSFFPLWLLTRADGPFFGGEKWPWYCNVVPVFKKAVIRFDYPVDRRVVEFFKHRCLVGWKYELVVEAPKLVEFDPPMTHPGEAMSLGNGKDSRALFGILRELGRPPEVYGSMREAPGGEFNEPCESVPGFPDVKKSIGCGSIIERLMPIFMSGNSTIYVGTGLGEAWYTGEPWQLFYDIGCQDSWDELCGFLGRCGMNIRVYTPMTVIPYNVTQNLLFRRYPDLYAGQTSTAPGSNTEKNLKIALLKLGHGIDPWRHCPVPLFKKLLSEWVGRTVKRSETHGVESEVRAMLWRIRSMPEVAHVRSRIREEWNQSWVDCAHEYINPTVGPDVLDIMHQYATPFESAPAGTMRIPMRQEA